MVIPRSSIKPFRKRFLLFFGARVASQGSRLRLFDIGHKLHTSLPASTTFALAATSKVRMDRSPSPARNDIHIHFGRWLRLFRTPSDCWYTGVQDRLALVLVRDSHPAGGGESRTHLQARARRLLWIRFPRYDTSSGSTCKHHLQKDRVRTTELWRLLDHKVGREQWRKGVGSFSTEGDG